MITGGGGIVGKGYGFAAMALMEPEGIVVARGNGKLLSGNDGTMAMASNHFPLELSMGWVQVTI